MATPLVGYTIADVATLTAIAAAERTEGYARLLLNDGNGEQWWVVFDADAATGDFTPDAGTGRWIKVGKYAGLDRAQTFTANQTVGTVTLVDGTNIPVDASLGNTFEVTLGGNRTLDNPTNLVDGQTLIFRIIQDATGSRTLAYGTAYKFPGGTGPTLTTTANAIDLLSCSSDGTNLHCVFTGDFS